MYLRRVFLIVIALLITGNAHASGKLDEIFKQDMLNTQVRYVETITGPAKKVWQVGAVQQREYMVQGCALTAYAKAGEVIGFTLKLHQHCNFNLGNFLGHGYTTTKNLTIGKFTSGPFGAALNVKSDCIWMCGNAADPSVDFIFKGPHAVNFVNVILTIVLSDQSSIAAAERWGNQMKSKEGEEYVSDVRFNCDQKYSALAVREFSHVKVSEVTIGNYDPMASSIARDCTKKSRQTAKTPAAWFVLSGQPGHPCLIDPRTPTPTTVLTALQRAGIRNEVTNRRAPTGEMTTMITWVSPRQGRIWMFFFPTRSSCQSFRQFAISNGSLK